jgi:hypothetical protein
MGDFDHKDYQLRIVKACFGLLFLGLAVFALNRSMRLNEKIKSGQMPRTIYTLTQAQALKVTARRGEILKFIPEEEIELTRIDGYSTNVTGWLVISNSSGKTDTNWFRCVFSQRGSKDDDFVTEFKMFLTRPEVGK